MSRRASLVAGLVLFAILMPGTARVGAAGNELERTRQRLAEIERRIEAATADLAEKRRDENQLLADLAAVSEDQERLERRIAGLKAELNGLEADIAAGEQSLKDLREATDALRHRLEERLAGMYKAGDGGLLRILFSGGSPAEVARNYHFLSRIVGRDRDLVETYLGRVAEEEQALQELAALRERRSQALEARRREQETLERAGRVQNRLLARLRRERSNLAQRLEQLRDRAARMADLVKRLESEKGPEYTEKSGLFSEQKGRLPWPLEAPVVVDFGTGRHPELGTLHESQGLEFAAGTGRNVQAVWDGRVAFADWFKGYGNLLILDHGDGYYSLYARIADLKKQAGETVTAGEIIGLSGYDGNPNLYFEIRHGGTPVNPRNWLSPR